MTVEIFKEFTCEASPRLPKVPPDHKCARPTAQRIMEPVRSRSVPIRGPSFGSSRRKHQDCPSATPWSTVEPHSVPISGHAADGGDRAVSDHAVKGTLAVGCI